MSFFQNTSPRLNLARDGSAGWRTPQLGAIGALLQSFSLDEKEPPLISIPTGTGKTAIALLAPHLASPSPLRVLIVEPSVELRRQVVHEAATQRVLKEIGFLAEDTELPSVLELEGRVKDWSEVIHADFVVAHPNSISPSHYEASPAPRDLFDMVVVDEAHHLAAPTWRAILDHFQNARAVLLTATPFRRDKRRIPGRFAYYYPLHRALAEGIYNPVEPQLLPTEAGAPQAAVDEQIATKAVEVLSRPEHASSAMLIRGRTVERAKELAAIYEGFGLRTEVLYSRLGEKRKAGIIERLRSGDTRAVAVVGMLSEGFDLPRLRVAAYHDKHRSTQSTVQLIGRLARVDPAFPQPSVLVVAQDAEVFPELRGVVRELYEEDADWVRVLPGLIDDEVARSVADQEYVEQFAESEGSIDPTLLAPLNRSSIYKLPTDWAPDLGSLPDALQVGRRIGRATVIYVGINPAGSTLVVGTRQNVQPRWSTDPRLLNVQFGLTVISYRPAPQVDMQPLLLENSDVPLVLTRIRSELGIDVHAQRVAPQLVSQYLDSIERSSISSVGLRAETNYRNLMGRDVGKQLRASDTARTGLGHVMLQTTGDEGRTITVGGATGKGKVWTTQYSSLRAYDHWVDDVTDRIWFARVGATGPILPGVSRGTRLARWPGTPIVSVDFAPEVHSRGWSFHDADGELIAHLEDVTLNLTTDEWRAPDPDGVVEIQASLSGDEATPFWKGALLISGNVHSLEGADVEVRRGYATAGGMADFLQRYPPSAHFLDGQRVEGHIVFDDRTRRTRVSPSILRDEDWEGTDLTAETRRTALERDNGKRSIHEAIEALIAASSKRGRGRRWVMCNDGKGELADHVVIEDLRDGRVGLEFWHSKAAGGEPGVRITDMQVVAAQALRSRRFIPSRDLWAKIHRRLSQTEFPYLSLTEGSDSEAFLRARLGFDHDRWPNGWRRSWRVLQPIPEAKIVIVQPGLSKGDLLEQAGTSPPSASAVDVLSLLTIVEDFAVAEEWTAEIVCSR